MARAALLCLTAGSLCLAAPVMGAQKLPARDTASAAPAQPTLTTAHSVHKLTLEEAAHATPVRLTGVVTYYDTTIDHRRKALFLHDETGAIFAAVTGTVTGDVHPGDRVEVTGVSGTGDYAPIVAQASVRRLGPSQLPKSVIPLNVTQMMAGRYDGQWVQLEGVVRAVEAAGEDHVKFTIAAMDGTTSAIMPRSPGVDYSYFVDSTIRVRGNLAPVFNGRLQLTGTHLFLPDLSALTVLSGAPGDPYALPLVPVHNLLRYTPDVDFRHRVHVRGAVTLQWPGRSLCLQENSGSLCVETTQREPVALGDVVDVLGFVSVGSFTPSLTDAVFRRTGAAQPIVAQNVLTKDALRGDYDGHLVQLEGRLIGKDRSAQDPTLMLASGKYLFPIVLQNGEPGAAGLQAANWKEGTVLRVTGICSVDWKEDSGLGFSIPSSFRILLRSPADIVIVRQPSWWTSTHLAFVLALVLALTLCLLAWALLLRRRVTEQTAVISAQNVTLTNLSFQDGLTRLANRRKFDDAIVAEFERARRSFTLISLLMIDIDHFKGLNDAFGHQHGDECLTQVAEALRSSSLRSIDLIARYGGEEFAVILPMCDLANAQAAAERMRLAIYELAIPNPAACGRDRVSISVGAACASPGAGATVAALITAADQALYRSKSSGRNCTTCTQLEVEDLSMINLAG